VSDERGLPVGTEPVDGTDFDFRAGRTIGTTKLDNAFSDLERPADGLARVELREPGGASVTLWADHSYGYLMLFTGDTQPDVNRRSIAVEPMTCPVNAFQSGESLINLEPGESTTSTWGIVPG
jgi:aldose 1-epimerase